MQKNIITYQISFCKFITISDCSEIYQTKFQDPASTVMEGIFIFNAHLLFIITIIVILVGWLMLLLCVNFTELTNSRSSRFTHSNTLEIIWTSVPAFVLCSLASPSFSLLYSLDEISNPFLTLKILGHQWYWSYELADFNLCSDDGGILKYSSYFITNEGLKEKNDFGFFRVLETNRKILLPTCTHLRLLVTSVDVLHSWTIPSFGVKVDACPGRLNQANIFIKRFGVFYGQCSEICGVNHGFMPIMILAMTSDNFHYFVMKKLIPN